MTAPARVTLRVMPLSYKLVKAVSHCPDIMSSDFRRHVQSATSTRLQQDRRAQFAITELHQQLLGERASRRRVHAAALIIGVRSTNAAKNLAQKAHANASNERRISQRDSLREARESAASVCQKMLFHLALQARFC